MNPASTVTLWFLTNDERGKTLPKKPCVIAHLKSRQTVWLIFGTIVLVSAANKSYPADPSVALTGSFAKTLSSKYLIVICFGIF